MKKLTYQIVKDNYSILHFIPTWLQDMCLNEFGTMNLDIHDIYERKMWIDQVRFKLWSREQQA